MTAFTVDDARDQKKVERCMRSALASKQYLVPQTFVYIFCAYLNTYLYAKLNT